MANKNFFDGPLTTRLLVLGFIFISAIYAGYILNIAASNQKFAAFQQQEDDIKEQLRLIIQKGTGIKYDLTQLPELKSKLLQWNRAIIDYSKLTEVLDEILKSGASKQLYFAEFNPGEGKPTAGYFTLPITVTVVGSYHQVAGFLSLVANLPTIVKIDKFSLSNKNTNEKLGSKLAETANAQNMVTADIAFSIFYSSNVPANPKGETKK